VVYFLKAFYLKFYVHLSSPNACYVSLPKDTLDLRRGLLGCDVVYCCSRSRLILDLMNLTTMLKSTNYEALQHGLILLSVCVPVYTFQI